MPATKETKSTSRGSLYRQLQPRWCGLDPEGVEKNQRLRLIGAMIEVAGSDGGYASANIKLLSALAGVSRRTFYLQYGTLEACFLATYEYVVSRAAKRVRVAFRSEKTWEAKLSAAFNAYASQVVGEPKAARVALVEVLGAGPRALQERDRGRQVFERMISSSFRDGPDGVELPPLVVKAIAGGIERITRLRLLGGGTEELPALADELLAWGVSYGSSAVDGLPSIGRSGALRWRSSAQSSPARSERARILRAAAQIAATAGYTHLTRAQILEQSQVSVEMFEDLFVNTEQCFLDALSLLGSEALACAAEASANAHDPSAAVRQGIAALLDHLAGNRVLQRIAFIEIFTVGPHGIERREHLLEDFNELFVSILPPSQRPSKLLAQAIVGGIWTVLHHFITGGAARQLSALADQLTYVALAPVIGAQAAVQSIQANSAGGATAAGVGS